MINIPSDKIRILLLNTDAIARAGVKLLLECEPGLNVIAQAGNRVQALELAGKEAPDIILVHENPADPLEPDYFSELLAVSAKSRIVLITSVEDQLHQLQAIKNGVVGILKTQITPEILYKAVEKVHSGEVWLDRSLMANFIMQKTRGETPVVDNPEAARIAQLSGREREIIALVGEGLKNQQIADQLFLSEVTVRHHLTSIYRKLRVSDRLELVIYAYQNGLAQIPE